MKKQDIPKEIFPRGKKDVTPPEVQENLEQLKINLLKGPEEKIYETYSDKKLDDAKLRFELLNNTITSLFDKWQDQNIIISENEIKYEPRFKVFLDLCGDLEDFTKEQRDAYHKPIIVPRTIKAVFYSRYPDEAWRHLDKKNPLGKGFSRKTKLYFYFGKGGILILEKFIYEAEEMMREMKAKGLKGLYQFRVLHSLKYGTGFQLELFQKYIEAI